MLAQQVKEVKPPKPVPEVVAPVKKEVPAPPKQFDFSSIGGNTSSFEEKKGDSQITEKEVDTDFDKFLDRKGG